MNCKQAKGKLALLIGNDLDALAIGEVQQHLAQCAGCREHLQRLSSCLEVLQVPAAGAFSTDGESLWPRISVRLASPTAGQKPHRLSGWASTLAVAASCAAMFWVASYQFVGDSGSPAYTMPSRPIPLQQIDQPLNEPPRLYQPQVQPVNPFQPINNGETRQPESQSSTMQLPPGTMRWID
ncbi:MAG TPA: hypothetical protein VEI07_13270 [Planctomycetaceae bacterium]|nr:hypothetical protein [Planctomycetaceae bacterium]